MFIKIDLLYRSFSVGRKFVELVGVKSCKSMNLRYRKVSHKIFATKYNSTNWCELCKLHIELSTLTRVIMGTKYLDIFSHPLA